MTEDSMSDEIDEPDALPDPEALDAQGKTIPLAQYNRAWKRMKRLEEQVASLTEAQTQSETAWTTKLAEAESVWASKESAWQEERGLILAGFTDPEAIEVARWAHSRQPEQGRKPLGEWLQELAADPTKAPKALSPYLAKPEPAAPADPPAQPAAPEAPASPAPPAPAAQGSQGAAGSRGVVQPAAAGSAAVTGELTGQQIREMNERAIRTGDFSEVLRHKDAIRRAHESRRTEVRR